MGEFGRHSFALRRNEGGKEGERVSPHELDSQAVANVHDSPPLAKDDNGHQDNGYHGNQEDGKDNV